MNVGTAWSIINKDTETSAPLPEALWHQELTENSPLSGEQAKPPGFFVSLLQRWDMASDAADSKYVFYQVSPFPAPTIADPDVERDGLKDGPKQHWQESCQYRIRLPRQLAVFDEIIGGDHGADGSDFESPSYNIPVSPRIQKRRIPLLSRFTDNQKVFFMQFSKSHVRIAVPIPEGESSAGSISSCKHWTIELKSCVKDPYIPVHSLPESLPKIRIPSDQRSQNTESILPGGLFWLNQSYGNAKGNDYQEFLLGAVTTNSLLCYTVTLNALDKRKPILTMKLSHTFAHPKATAAWWQPKILVLLVASTRPGSQQLFLKTYFFGENGPFTSRRDVLRNPLLLPLRLERPPPLPCKAFPMGHSKDLSQQSRDISKVSSSPSLESKTDCVRLAPLVAVVQMYGRAFILEVGTQTIQMQSGEYCLAITLHELERDNCGVKIGEIQELVTVPKGIRSSEEDILVTTLDDVLCITCRKSKLHIFLDIQDIKLGQCSQVVESFATDKEHKYLQPKTSILFIPPDHLFLPERGVLTPLSLYLERMSPTVSKGHRCNFSMILRRRQGQAREFGLSQFSDIVSLSSVDQRLRWINHAAVAYASCDAVSRDPPVAQRKDHISPFQFDLRASLFLMFQCALLSPDCPLLHDLLEDNIKLDKLPSLAANNVIFQTDILTRIFLPQTLNLRKETRRTKTSESKTSATRRVAELSLFYRDALEHHGSMPCPALECFAFALLWRLGDAQALFALLKSSTFVSRSDPKASNMNSQTKLLSYLSTKWQATLLLSIINDVEFGSVCLSKGKKECTQAVRNRAIQVSLAMLATGRDYRLPADLIAQLLLQMRLQEAMSVACSLLEVSEGKQPPGDTRKIPSAALVQAKRRNHGEDFVNVAQVLMSRTMNPSSAETCRLLQSLYSFLLKWDPECLPQDVHIVKSKRAARDDSGLRLPFRSDQSRIHRRPSATGTATASKPLELLCIFRDLKQGFSS